MQKKTHRWVLRCVSNSSSYDRLLTQDRELARGDPIVSLTRRCFWLEYRFYKFCLFAFPVSCTA